MNEFLTPAFLLAVERFEMRELAPSTIKSYSCYLKGFLEFLEKDNPFISPEDITMDDACRYSRYLSKEKNAQPRTVNSQLAVVSTFYRYVLEREWDERICPKKRVFQYLPYIPTIHQVSDILGKIQNQKRRAAVALMYGSGLRVSEVVALRISDIHIHNGFYVNVAPGKNRMQRQAPLSYRSFLIVREYLAGLQPVSGRKLSGDDWVFPGQTDGRHLDAASIRKGLSDDLEAAGYGGYGMTPHCFRTAFACHLYAVFKTDLVTIKFLMGHRSLRSTEQYIKLSIGINNEIRSPLDAIHIGKDDPLR